MWIHLVAAVFQITFMTAKHHYTKPMSVDECIKQKRCIVQVVDSNGCYETKEKLLICPAAELKK